VTTLIAREALPVENLVEAAMGVGVARLRWWSHPYSTSHVLLAVDFELEDGRVVAAVLKESSTRPAFRPAFVHCAHRERDTYATILGPGGAPAPRFLGAVGPYILLERADGVPLWEVDDERALRAAGRAVRTTHALLAEHAQKPFLLLYDAHFFRRWLRRAIALDASLAAIADVCERSAWRLLREPRSVIHGELYPSNVLVSGDSIVIVDWETTAVGPAAFDLGALTSGWSRPHADAFLSGYGAADPVAVDCARLHLALRWLGWSARWQAPTEHARDWRQEAMQVATRLRGSLH
jgi:aminoglycoside phosphotransferase (APT) family kinase protein